MDVQRETAPIEPGPRLQRPLDATGGAGAALVQRIALAELSPQEAYRRLVHEPNEVLPRAGIVVEPTLAGLRDGERYLLADAGGAEPPLTLQVELRPHRDMVRLHAPADDESAAERTLAFERADDGGTVLSLWLDPVPEPGADGLHAGEQAVWSALGHALAGASAPASAGAVDASGAVILASAATPPTDDTAAMPVTDPTTVAYARLSKDAYGLEPVQLGERFHRLAPAEIARDLGVDPGLLHDEASGYDARLYYDRAEDRHVLANRGTEGLRNPDTVANIRQGLGLGSAHYDRAVHAATQLAAATGGKVAFTGHSLGGGLAAAQALATGQEAITYNAAGLHGDTIARLGLDASAAHELISAVHVDGELLTRLQENPLADAAVFGSTLLSKNTVAGIEYIADRIRGRDPNGAAFGFPHVPAAQGEALTVPALGPDGEPLNFIERIRRSAELHGIDAVIRALEQLEDRGG